MVRLESTGESFLFPDFGNINVSSFHLDLNGVLRSAMAGSIGTVWPLRDGWIRTRQPLRIRILIDLDSYWQSLLLNNMNIIYSSLAFCPFRRRSNSCSLCFYPNSLWHNRVSFSCNLRKIWAFSSILTNLRGYAGSKRCISTDEESQEENDIAVVKNKQPAPISHLPLVCCIHGVKYISRQPEGSEWKVRNDLGALFANTEPPIPRVHVLPQK